MKSLAELWYRLGWIVVRTTWVDGFVDDLKATVPSAARRWVAAEKVWLVSRDWEAVLLEILGGYFDQIAWREREWMAPPPPSARAEAYARLHLLPTAPPELVDGAYRILAKQLHPDVNPRPDATRAMQELTAAWKAIRAELAVAS